jgi:hypothetical protein
VQTAPSPVLHSRRVCPVPAEYAPSLHKVCHSGPAQAPHLTHARRRSHTFGGVLISSTWNLLAVAVGAVFGTHVVLWNIVPFCADCDADSNGNKLVKGIPAGDLNVLAVLQKLWLGVRPPLMRSHAPTVAFAVLQCRSTCGVPIEYAGAPVGPVKLGQA